jgi:hypothetical protein
VRHDVDRCSVLMFRPYRTEPTLILRSLHSISDLIVANARWIPQMLCITRWGLVNVKTLEAVDSVLIGGGGVDRCCIWNYIRGGGGWSTLAVKAGLSELF